MSIFGKYTFRSLAKNKTRTFVTVLGIVLSVAMFTAVTEAVASMRGFLVKGIEYELGSFHAQTSEIDSAQLEALRADKEIKQTETLGDVGYADIGSQNEYKPYLYIMSMSDGFTDMVSVRLTSGRLPQNSGEIALPMHLSDNGNVNYKLGDVLTLSVGDRMSDGYKLGQQTQFFDDELLVPRVEKTYTVVGFYERFSTAIEPYSAPGYTALTTGERTETCKAFFKLKSAGGTYDFIDESEGRYGDISANRDLLMLYGVSRHATAMRALVGMAAILIGLIMFGSVSLIYNSFSISVGERTKQFGILKSIGATKKQIRRTVFYEALYLCAAAVPLGIFFGCAGLGITFYLLRGAFDRLGFVFGINSSIVLKLMISPAALITAAVIGVVTTVISAYLPARRAVKIPAIEAVRRTNDITVKNVKIPASKLTYKLFGFEGMIAAKNFRRNKRRYRTAVLSLFMSVVLFVSASSFCKYLTDSASAANTTNGYDIVYSVYDDEDMQENERIYKILSAADGVTESVMCSIMYKSVLVDWDLISDSAFELYYGSANVKSESDFENIAPAIYYIDDSEYEKLAKDNKITVDINNPGAIVYDCERMYTENKDGDYVLHKIELFDRSKTSSRIETKVIVSREGYNFFKIQNGTVYYIPYDLGNDENEIITEEDMLKVSADEALETVSYDVAGFAEEAPFFETSGPAFIYPRSAFNAEAAGENVSTYMYFVSDNHKKSYNKMLSLLDELDMNKSQLYDYAESIDSDRALVTVINVFAYGFIILISLIALTNVFNTVSTNIFLRRRELAMLKSVGMTRSGFNKMMNYECIICGARGLMLGLPVSVLVTFLIYKIINNGYAVDFYMPWYSIAIAVFSVFAVVFIAMLYSMRKIRKENTIDTLRNENI